MSIKAFFAKKFAKKIYDKTQKWARNPVETQERVFKNLIQQAKDTQFGKDHNFSGILSYSDFAKNVPIRDYEGLKTYIEKVKKGEENV